jgi:hypothetical protein
MYVQGDAYHKEHMQASIGDYEFNDRRSERRGRSKTSSTKLSSTKLSPTTNCRPPIMSPRNVAHVGDGLKPLGRRILCGDDTLI